MQKENKVFYGLKNVHYSKITVGENGKEEYAKPVKINGAVSISVSAEGEIKPFFADDTTYYITSSNKGYKGDLEIATLPESFRTDILGDSKTSKGILLEKSNNKPSQFALLFEFDGDEKATRHILYRCTAKRPTMESETKGEDIEVKKEKLEFEAHPNSAGVVKARTSSTVEDETYNGWYTTVYVEGEE